MMSTTKTITDLPQEILVEVFSYLSAEDILNVGECLQTEAVWGTVGNKRLWKNVEISDENLKKYKSYCGSHTTSLTGKGKANDLDYEADLITVHNMMDNLLSNLKSVFTNLMKLTINNFIIDTSLFSFSFLPTTLETLVFDNVTLVNTLTETRRLQVARKGSPFYEIDSSFQNLKKFELVKTVCVTLNDIRALTDYEERCAILISEKDKKSLFEESIKYQTKKSDTKMENRLRILMMISDAGHLLTKWRKEKQLIEI